MIVDSDKATFMHDVVEASSKLPVLVYFWSPLPFGGAGLKSTLGKIVRATDGRIKLVQIEVKDEYSEPTKPTEDFTPEPLIPQWEKWTIPSATDFMNMVNNDIGKHRSLVEQLRKIWPPTLDAPVVVAFYQGLIADIYTFTDIQLCGTDVQRFVQALLKMAMGSTPDGTKPEDKNQNSVELAINADFRPSDNEAFKTALNDFMERVACYEQVAIQLVVQVQNIIFTRNVYNIEIDLLHEAACGIEYIILEIWRDRPGIITSVEVNCVVCTLLDLIAGRFPKWGEKMSVWLDIPIGFVTFVYFSAEELEAFDRLSLELRHPVRLRHMPKEIVLRAIPSIIYEYLRSYWQNPDQLVDRKAFFNVLNWRIEFP